MKSISQQIVSMNAHHSTADIMCDILRLRIRLHEEAIDKSSAEEDVEFRENMIRGLYKEINFWRNKK